VEICGSLVMLVALEEHLVMSLMVVQSYVLVTSLIWRKKEQSRIYNRNDRHKQHFFNKEVSLLSILSEVLFASIFPICELKWVWMMIFMW
jgi:hypothetical protein